MATGESASKLIFSYNSFLIDFLLLMKHVSPELKKCIKERYRSVDKRNASHIDFGVAHLPLDALASSKPAGLADAGAATLDSLIVEGIMVRDVVEYKAPDGADEDVQDTVNGRRNGMLRILYVLASLARLRRMETGDRLEGVLELIMRIQAVGAWTGWPEPAPAISGLETDIASVEDPCIRGLLNGLFTMCVSEVTTNKSLHEDVPEALRETFERMQKSKIGTIAKEVAEEIDFSGIDATHPEEWLNLANIADPNSFLGKVIGKLGSKLSAKIATGDLDQDDLVNDAKSLVEGMGFGGPNGPSGAFDLMSSLMAGGGGNNKNNTNNAGMDLFQSMVPCAPVKQARRSGK